MSSEYPFYPPNLDYQPQPRTKAGAALMILPMIVVLLVIFLGYCVRLHESWIRRRIKPISSPRRPPAIQLPRRPNVSLNPATSATQSQNSGGDLKCAACLHPFKEKETARVLPNCVHRFHTDCINMWLPSTTCPYCTTTVEPQQPVLEAQSRRPVLESTGTELITSGIHDHWNLEQGQSSTSGAELNTEMDEGTSTGSASMPLAIEMPNSQVETLNRRTPFPSDHSAERHNEDNGQ